jgi:hypothetical protein
LLDSTPVQHVEFAYSEKKGEWFMKPSIIFTVVFLLLVAILHVLRLIFQVRVTIGDNEVPMLTSIAAAIFSAGLALWLLRDNKKA